MTNGGLFSAGRTEELLRYGLRIITESREESQMLPTNRIPTHPGEMLLEEFLLPLKVSQVRFAAHLGIPTQRVNEIVNGKRGVTPETALLFAAALGTSPEFWINLQGSHDLAMARSHVKGMPIALIGAARDLIAAAASRRATTVVHKKK
jgi:addiction module HigA family antidote